MMLFDIIVDEDGDARVELLAHGFLPPSKGVHFQVQYRYILEHIQ